MWWTRMVVGKIWLEFCALLRCCFCRLRLLCTLLHRPGDGRRLHGPPRKHQGQAVGQQSAEGINVHPHIHVGVRLRERGGGA